MKNTFFNIQNEAGIPTIHVTGEIGKDVDYSAFRNAILTLVQSGAKRVKMIVNSVGGSMAEGFAMFDYIGSLGLTVEVNVIGMAASMGGVLMQCASPGLLGIHENALIMTHKPQSRSVGESDTHRASADLSDKLERKAKQIYLNRGVKEEAMADWFKPGQMKWFTAEEALAAGMVDYIISAKPGDPKPTQPANSFDDEGAAFQYYNTFIPTNNTEKPIIKMNKLIASVVLMLNNAGITTVNLNSTEDEVVAALTKFNTDNSATITNLKNQIATVDKTRAKDLIANMKLIGKLPADLDDAATTKWENKAEKDYDGITEVFALMPDKVATAAQMPDFNASLNKAADKKADTNSNELPANKKDWTYGDYEKEDPKALRSMMHNNPEEFKKLYKNYYGTEITL